MILSVVLVAVVLLVTAVLVIVGLDRQRRLDVRDAALLDALIRAKGATQRYSGFDPDLRQRTAAKRRGAEDIRRIAARVNSGAHIEGVLEDVKKAKQRVYGVH